MNFTSFFLGDGRDQTTGVPVEIVEVLFFFSFPFFLFFWRFFSAFIELRFLLVGGYVILPVGADDY